MLKNWKMCEKLGFFSTLLGLMAMVFLLLLSNNMQRGGDHDENIYIASGKLLGSKSLIPFKDYLYLHMPNQSFMYGAIFRYTDYNLLAGRIFSAVCATLIIGLIFSMAFGELQGYHYLVRFFMGAACVLLILTNPLFVYATGYCWNYTLPSLFCMLAFLCHCRGAKKGNPKAWLFLGGIFMGGAIGSRISYAPAILAFLFVIFLYPDINTAKRRLLLLFSFCLGAFISLLPSILLFALAPKQFLFGTISLHLIDALRIQTSGVEGAITLAAKFRYLKREILSGTSNLMLSFLFTFIMLTAGRHMLRRRKITSFPFLLAVLLTPFLLMGSFAASPSHYQYFYAPVPFMLLGVVYGIGIFRGDEDKRWGGLVLLILGVAVSWVYGVKYPDISSLRYPDQWYPVKAHKIGGEIANEVKDGRVLTLSPLYPLEGRVEIYKEFASGVFGWRIGYLLQADQRRDMGIVAEDDLNDFLKTGPPKGILVGDERRNLEMPLVKYAKDNGYRELRLSNGMTLWINPR